MNLPDAAPSAAADRRWRRGVRGLGLVVAAVATAVTVGELDSSLATALLAAGLALWLVELLATPAAESVEAALLVLLGGCGAALRGVAPDSAGFLLAYFAAAAIGLRLSQRRALAAIGSVLAAMAAGVLLSGAPHTATSLTTDLLGVAFAFAVASATRQARLANERARALIAELEETRAAQAEAAALGERARLAREIHDILAHALSGQVMSLEAARMLAERTGADPRLIDQVERAHRLARSGLAETRDAVHALRGDATLGPELVPDLVADARTAHGLDASVEVRGTARRVPAEVGLALYRTVQEALTNTAKHAGRGASVRVVLAWQEDQVVLTVTDIRTGPVAAEVRLPGAGYGLTGLRERARLAGGSLDSGATDSGFQVTLRLPYRHGEQGGGSEPPSAIGRRDGAR